MVFNYGLVVTDAADASPTVSVIPPQGSLLPPGENVITCTAVDASGNTNSVEFTITVEDRTAPQIICPPNLSLLKNTEAGADLNYPLTVLDAGDTNLMVESSHPDGSVLPLGTTSVFADTLQIWELGGLPAFRAVADTLARSLLGSVDVRAESPFEVH